MILPIRKSILFVKQFSKKLGLKVAESLLSKTSLENDIKEILTENIKDFADIPGIKASNPVQK